MNIRQLINSSDEGENSNEYQIKKRLNINDELSFRYNPEAENISYHLKRLKKKKQIEDAIYMKVKYGI